MEDNRSKKLEDEFANAALDLLLDEYAGSSGAQMLEEYTHFCSGSPMDEELDRICSKKIRRTFQKQHFLKAAARCGKTAMILLVCLCFGLTLVLSVEALRVPFLNYFLVRFPQYTQVIFQPEAGEKEPLFTSLHQSSPEFAPEGYTMFQADHGDSFFLSGYQNDAGDVASIGVYTSEGSLRVDSENCTETKLTVNGMDAVHWQKIGQTQQTLLLIDPENGVTCVLYASNLEETEFWHFVYTFAAFL